MLCLKTSNLGLKPRAQHISGFQSAADWSHACAKPNFIRDRFRGRSIQIPNVFNNVYREMQNLAFKILSQLRCSLGCRAFGPI
jgi:hypothetical protein